LGKNTNFGDAAYVKCKGKGSVGCYNGIPSHSRGVSLAIWDNDDDDDDHHRLFRKKQHRNIRKK